MIGIAILLAVLASVGYGVSDVVSGAVVRRHATASLALWAQATGLAVLGVGAVVLRPEVPLPGIVWGAAAGVLGALAVLAFYTALQRGRTAVVASVSGSGVVIPVLAGLIGGDPVGWQAGAGVFAAVAGVLVVAAAGDQDTTGANPAGDVRKAPYFRATPGRTQPVPVHDGCVPQLDSRSGRSSVVLAAAAAIGFGFFFVLLDRATTAAATTGISEVSLDSALMIALAVQIGALAVTIAAATRHTRACLRPGRDILLFATAVGLLDVAADLVLTFAVAMGPLAVVGPLGSLDPVVAVLIATAVLRERLRRLQLLGVVMALIGIVLVATG